jgi:hypothetical protein
MTSASVGCCGNYPEEPKLSLLQRVHYKLTEWRYSIGPYAYFALLVWVAWTFHRFVEAVENSHLLIGLVE